jgi:LysR family transcriptional regulator, flagellar master operon regulator
MRSSLKDIALRVHVDVPQDLIIHIANGVVDAAIMYAPQHRPGVKIIRLMDERLVLVRTTERGLDKSYVHVDWGPEVALRQAAERMPDVPSVSCNLGPLALNYLLANGGSGYFRMSAVEPHLASGKLQRVPGTPELAYPIYLVHSAFAESSVLEPALAGLRHLSSMP